MNICRTIQEENDNWFFEGFFLLTIGGANSQSNVFRRPRVFLTNHGICF